MAFLLHLLTIYYFIKIYQAVQHGLNTTEMELNYQKLREMITMILTSR